MGRIRACLDEVREEGRSALVIYLCAGDPDLATTPRLIEAAAASGADIIEVGVPFSDPTADGMVIQRASARALARGASLRGTLACVKEARQRTEVPILLFGYFSPVLAYGEEQLAEDAKASGVDGVLVVDLPVEECARVHLPVTRAGLDYVPLVAPTSSDRRIDAAARVATGFLYYVSLTGVTGAEAPDLGAAARRAGEVQRRTGIPVALGFGVRTADDVRQIARHVNGVVVGSAVVQVIEAADSADGAVAAVSNMVAELARGK